MKIPSPSLSFSLVLAPFPSSSPAHFLFFPVFVCPLILVGTAQKKRENKLFLIDIPGETLPLTRADKLNPELRS